MSSKTLLSVEEYLHTTFDGSDQEYIDGELVERNMGTLPHGDVQTEVAFQLKLQTRGSGKCVVVEVRAKLGPALYRIPDVALYSSKPATTVPTEPPLAAIEVLSPDDRMNAVLAKLREYQAWGVANVWLADPEDRKFFIYSDQGLHETTKLEIPAHGIALTLDAVFGPLA
jgi:Uma2 family endonuclease